MPINKENLLQHELIGLKVEVVQSEDSSIKGKKGVIMNETKKTLTIEEEGDLKKLPKKGVSLSITLPEGENVKVNGKKIIARPQDRVKKLR